MLIYSSQANYPVYLIPLNNKSNPQTAFPKTTKWTSPRNHSYAAAIRNPGAHYSSPSRIPWLLARCSRGNKTLTYQFRIRTYCPWYLSGRRGNPRKKVSRRIDRAGARERRGCFRCARVGRCISKKSSKKMVDAYGVPRTDRCLRICRRPENRAFDKTILYGVDRPIASIPRVQPRIRMSPRSERCVR